MRAGPEASPVSLEDTETQEWGRDETEMAECHRQGGTPPPQTNFRESTALCLDFRSPEP